MRNSVFCLDCGGPVDEAAGVLSQAGWAIHGCSDVVEANGTEGGGASIGLAVFGSRAPSETALQDIEQLLEARPTMPWLALIAPEMRESPQVLRLLCSYFRDCLSQPIDSQCLLHSVDRAYEMSRIRDKRAQVVTGVKFGQDNMLAESAVMQPVLRTLRKCARSSAPVLITGESGTGKELAAKSIHRHSAHSGGPFVAVNCGAIPENLIQAELFGHTRGAFTGADREKMGRIEAAHGGTLFLDEIGDLSMALQVNLLRFLQEGVIEKVGSNKSVHVNARVVAATHRDLEQQVKTGEFREDLYYRLNVLRVVLPPLRDRYEEIESLATAYLQRFAAENEARANGFSRQAMQLIKAYDWPGNIRELVNRIQRAVIMSDTPLLTPADMGLDRRSGDRSLKTLEQARFEADRRALVRALNVSGHNIAETARFLEVSRLTVYRLIERHGIEVAHPINGTCNKR